LQSACDIICFQETKKEIIDIHFVKQICPSYFDAFEFLPSVGASGGLLVVWKSNLFTRSLIFNSPFAMSVQFTSNHNDEDWVLTNVYGPCHLDGKKEFTTWLKNIEMLDDINWIILGDFNLIRRQKIEINLEVALRKCFCSMKL
jgi:exonuclease III